jgi:hypothetical protein
MKTVFLALLVIALLIACGKDKFQTKPQLRIKSVNQTTVPVNGSAIFRIEFTDKEGDVIDSFFVRRLRLNNRVVPTVRDSFWSLIPDFPKAQKGDIVLTLTYQNAISAINPPNQLGVVPPRKESDTLIFKFLAIDHAGNRSDTVVSDRIIVERQ